MNCRICAELLQDYVDHSLTSELLEELADHIENCEHCRVIFHTYSLTVHLSHQAVPTHPVSPEMINRLTSLICEHLNNVK